MEKLVPKFLFACLLQVACQSFVFSQCVVTNTSGNAATANSLPWCVTQVNYSGAGPQIEFTLPGTGKQRIILENELQINTTMVITGPNPAVTEVIIDGSAMVASWDPTANAGILHMGWDKDISGTEFHNLSLVNNNIGPGINVYINTGNVDNLIIDNLNVGVEEDGTYGGNSDHGITLGHDIAGTTTSGWVIKNSTISGNKSNGINLQGAEGFEITNNVIGPIPDGSSCVNVPAAQFPYADASLGGGNGYDGLYSENSSNLTINGNIISCNGHATDPTDLTTLINGTPAGYLGKRGIYFQNTDNSFIYDNKIGTDLLGTTALPNYKSGILISTGSDGNIIGGSSSDSTNIISGNGSTSALYSTIADRHGIVIDNGGEGVGGANASGKNRISGNYVGLSSSGAVLGNVKNGIEVIGEGFENIIGGPSKAYANVVSGNGANGISIGQGSSDNTIQNNFVGTDINGTNQLAGTGNGNVGIQLNSGTSGDVVSFSDIHDNKIYDNIIGKGVIGIQTIGDASIDGVEILRNIIGEDINGDLMGPTGSGILIQSDLTGIEIGNNTIVNSAIHGISIEPTTSTGINNRIYGNNIGVETDGTSIAGNLGNGINIVEAAKGIIIGGTGLNEENVIVDNEAGIFVDGTDGAENIQIISNYIGLLSDGITTAGNTTYGIQIVDVPDLIIGNIGGTDGNIIAGNTSGGTLINGANSSATIEGNTFGITGTQSAGNALTINDGTHTINNNSILNYVNNGIAIADGLNEITNNNISETENGIYISGGTNTIGTPGNGNEVYETTTSGIHIFGIDGTTNATTIDANNIHDVGTTNDNHGIIVDASATNINIGVNEGNTIVNNAGAGIYLGEGGNHMIENNYIGFDVANTVGANNIGINIDASSGNTISSNFIGGNTSSGISIFNNGADGNTISSNFIGTNANGDDLSNQGTTASAIQITDGIGNIIDDNTIAGTAQAHLIESTGGTDHIISNNTIGTQNGNDLSSTESAIYVTSDVQSIKNNVLNHPDDNTAAIQIDGANALVDSVFQNYIGVDQTETKFTNPTYQGISITGGTTGPTLVEGNVISNIETNGIVVDDANAITINANFIGVNSTENTITDASITGSGIAAQGGTNISITANIIGNVNGLGGVEINGADGTIVNSNFIGINQANTNIAALGAGIYIHNGGINSDISTNTIANNPEGILVTDASSTGNTFSQNSIFCNESGTHDDYGTDFYGQDTIGSGISLYSGGNNDFLDGSLGYNLDTIFPEVIINDAAVAGNSSVNFDLDLFGVTGAVTMEVFENDPDCNNCQGKTFVGTVTQTGGVLKYNLGTTVNDCGAYTITLTEVASGNTSTFSDCSACTCTPSPAIYDPLLTSYRSDTINLCFGEDTTLIAQAVPGAIFQWLQLDINTPTTATSLNGAGVVDQTSQVVNQTGLYVFTVDNGDCPTTSDTVAVVLHAIPDPLITGLDSLCENSTSETYTSTNPTVGTSYTWGVSGATGTSTTATIDLDFTNTNTELNVTETFTMPGGDGVCFGQDTFDIVVHPLPDLQISANTPICLGDTSTISIEFLEGTGDFDIEYTANTIPLTANSVASDTSISFVPLTSGTYNYEVTSLTDAKGCVRTTGFTQATASTASTVINDTTPLVPTQADICESATSYTYTEPVGATGGTFSPNTITPNVLGAGTYDFTYTYTNADGCTSINPGTVTVNALPVVTFSDLADICHDNSSIDLSTMVSPDPSTQNLGVFSGTGITGTSFDANSTAATGGTYAITYTFTDDNNCVNDTTTDITVNPLPDLQISANTPICLEDTSTVSVQFLEGTGDFDIAFTANGIPLAANSVATDTSISFVPTTPGSYDYEVTSLTDAKGCVRTTGFTQATASTLVNANPAIGTSPVGPLCIDAAKVDMMSAVDIADEPGFTFGTPVNASNEFDPMVAGDGTFDISIEYIDANNCIDSTGITIIVNDTTHPVLTGVLYCSLAGEQDVTDLFTSDTSIATGGTFYLSSDVGGVAQTTFDPSGKGDQSFSYTYVSTNPAGCPGSASADIHVEDPTAVTFTPFATDFCINSSAVAITGGSETSEDPVKWYYHDDGEGTVSGSNGVYTFDPSKATSSPVEVYFVFGTGLCKDSAAISIIINDTTPVTPTQPEVCVSETSYSYTTPVGASGGTFTPANFNPKTSGAATHDFTYTYTNTNGCTSVNPGTITVNALPVVTFAALDDVCQTGNDVSLLSKVTPASNTQGGGIFSGTGVTGTNFSPSSTSTLGGSYTLTYTFTDDNSCVNSTTSDITVEAVTDVPDPVLSSTENCAGSNITVTLDNFSVYKNPIITWSGSVGTVSANKETYSSTGFSNGDVISIQIIDETCTAETPAVTETVNGTETITVHSYPVLETIDDVTICYNESATINATETSGTPASYSWTSNTSTSNSANYNLAGTYTVTAVNSSFNCPVSETFTVSTVTPEVTASANKSYMQAGETVLLSALHTSSINYGKHEWFIDDQIIGSTSELSYETTGKNNSVETFTIIAEVAGLPGCIAEDDIKIQIIKPISTPYLFSPNGDGNNDLWTVANLENYSNTEVKLFNRWGMQVRTLEDGEYVWDGNNANGTPLPDGVYYYIVTGSNVAGSVNLNGYVTIVH